MKTASLHPTTATSAPTSSPLQLACLAASPSSVRAAIDAGADWVRIPYRVTHSCMSRFKNERSGQTIRYAHGRGRKLALDLNISAPGVSWKDCCDGVTWASAQGFDAIVLSDITLALYCATRFPALPLHVIAHPMECARTATFLKLHLNAARIVIPHTLSVAQLVEIAARTNVEVEVLASREMFIANARNAGSRTLPPEWATGDTPCNDPHYSSKGYLSATLQQLPLMASLGVRVIHVEPRNDMPEEVGNVTQVWRQAIDRCTADADHYAVDPAWPRMLGMQQRH